MPLTPSEVTISTITGCSLSLRTRNTLTSVILIIGPLRRTAHGAATFRATGSMLPTQRPVLYHVVAALRPDQNHEFARGWDPSQRIEERHLGMRA
jgi:hypothetical protein